MRNTISPRRCLYSPCGKKLTPSDTGRPGEYCSTKCRQAAHRERIKGSHPDTQRYDTQLREGLAHLTKASENLGRTLNDPTAAAEEPLRQFTEIVRTLEQLTPAMVGRTRTARASWETIAPLLGMSKDTARRKYSSDAVDRALNRPLGKQQPGSHSVRAASARARRAPAPPTPQQQPLTEDTGDPPAAAAPRPVTSETPSLHQRDLASVLSSLQRASGHSLRALSLRTGLSPSYLSRLMNGERFPTWHNAAAIARACGADPAILELVWRQARTHRTDTEQQSTDNASSLASALRYLHQRAGSPPPAVLALKSGEGSMRICQNTIEELLAGTTPGRWEEVQRLIQLLDGEDSYFRPRWEEHTHTSETDPSPPPRRPAAPGTGGRLDDLLTAFAHSFSATSVQGRRKSPPSAASGWGLQ
ncbi:helix-turn-helix transcriptional regulator [Streptomyces chumphonensis]|uniref:Helix-turn-helix transcriptional regulator n=1 Tax=Streptomyces chumphonensis TaxID=1214925 RepID=A0A927F4Y6_9ACTN|nr:helix-turn-helix transcriptional regulator [Streptomyces chumphonensis]MBD3934872.1 helix-turn-helix transcriptional regulator [Streptomyces chumphonensis]